MTDSNDIQMKKKVGGDIFDEKENIDKMLYVYVPVCLSKQLDIVSSPTTTFRD